MLGFVHIPKTAGSSVKFILRNSLGLGYCNVRLPQRRPFGDADLAFARKVWPGLRAISGHRLVNPVQSLQTPIQLFTLLRDPLQRAASHFQQNVRHSRARGGDYTFDKYMSNRRTWNRQVRKLVGKSDVERAKRELADRYFFVGLSERFADSMTILGHLSPVPLDLRYPRLHVSHDTTEKKRVLDDPGTRRLLVEANELDLELYAFACERLFPRWEGLVDEARQKAREFPHVPRAWRAALNRGYSKTVYKAAVALFAGNEPARGRRGEAAAGAGKTGG